MPVVDSADLPERQPKPGWRGRFCSSDHTLHSARPLGTVRAMVVDTPRREEIGGVRTG